MIVGLEYVINESQNQYLECLPTKIKNAFEKGNKREKEKRTTHSSWCIHYVNIICYK